MGATCFNTLDDSTRDIPPEVWNEIAVGPDHRFGMICTEPKNFDDWKATIIKLCKLARYRCTYDAKRKVVEFHERVENFMAETQEIKELYIPEPM